MTSVESHSREIETYSAFSISFRDFMCTISPLLVTYLLTNFSITKMSFLLLALQVILLILAGLITNRQNIVVQVYNILMKKNVKVKV
jgi:hypothetical protein